MWFESLKFISSPNDSANGAKTNLVGAAQAKMLFSVCIAAAAFADVATGYLVFDEPLFLFF